MFTESAEVYDAIYSFKDYAAESAQVAAVVRAIHPEARTVLDIACGTGEHARHLAANHGFDVDGLDLDAGLLRVAREKHPTGRFFQADMSEFALEKRYDVLLCLFSSIGYLVTLERMRRALNCFREHLGEGGVSLVEPWFPPGGLEDGRVFRNAGTHLGRAVERISRNEIDDRISRLHFDYSIDTPEGTRRVSEVHELGLFTTDEMAAAFRGAGLRAEFDPVGLTGRGLWVARSAAPAMEPMARLSFCERSKERARRGSSLTLCLGINDELDEKNTTWDADFVTHATQRLLDEIEALPDRDRSELVAELARRVALAPHDLPHDDDLVAAADRLFTELDRREQPE